MPQTVQGFRLSPQQARLWSLLQQSNGYRAYCSVLLEGDLDILTLRRALKTVLARNEMYRTSFRRLPGMKVPIQYIHEDPLYTWQFIDLRDCEPQEQEVKAAELTHKERSHSIDGEQGPLFRCLLLGFSIQKYILQVSMHVLHADVQSLYAFVRELANVYASSNSATASEDEVVQYVQFSEWQNALLDDEQEAREREYWRKMDLAALSNRVLPFERKTMMPEPFVPGSLAVTLAPDACAHMYAVLAGRDEAQPLRVSPAPFLLACWQILLWRLTGHSEVLIGLGVDGRVYDELADTVGLMAKYLPLSCSLREDLSFCDLLAQVKDSCDKLQSLQPYFTWADLPGMVDSSSPLYPFCFDFREQPATCIAGEVSISLQECYSCYEPFNVSIVASRNSTAITVEFHYHTGLFDIRDIQLLARQFTTLLESAASQPEAHIGTLNMLSSVERELILTTFNQTSAPYPSQACFHHLFESQATATPDAVALQHEEAQITYYELNKRANQLAHHLQSLGVGPEVTVGIYLERSIALLVGVLGVLKAGGAYVPLNPIYPQERLAFMIKDAQVSVLLTDGSDVSLPYAPQIVSFDADWPIIARLQGNRPPTSDVLPTNLAYIIYTSGSTGQPKGVMIPHQGLVHYIDWCSKYYHVGAGTGAPVHSPLAFDLTITALFAPLVVGRRVVLVPDVPGTEALSKVLLASNDFSLVKITPAHLDALSHYLQPEQLARTTSALIIGGEALHGESLAPWHLHAPDTRLINEYGPTETVVGCCIYELPSTAPATGNIPIGRPIPNTRLYVLDAQLQPVPIGVPGELYIGGCGVGRGYLNRADLTAERFISDPFSMEPGARLYKTGDMVRYISSHGDLEYLGRLDHQVKLRGYRIELEEVGAALLRHPNVRDGIVLLREDEPHQSQLVAYVVAKSRPAPSLSELRDFMRQKLPAYMLPSALVLLNDFPLTVNGKLDRQALPPPSDQHDVDSTYTSPRSPIEEGITEIWEDLLKVRPIGVYDNFFNLGGHSLLATQCIARLQSTFGVEMPLRSLFDVRNLAELAMHVEEALRREQVSELPPLVPMARDMALPLSFAQQRLWFLNRVTPGDISYNIAHALRIASTLNIPAFEQALLEVVRRHEGLRAVFPMSEGDPVQVIRSVADFRWHFVDLRGVPADIRKASAQQVSQQEALQPFNLALGPLLRVTLLCLSEQEAILLLTMHHIISDGWSNSIFMQELMASYEACVAGLPVALAPLPIQYADFAIWQRQWMQGEILERQLAYWRQQLAGAFPLELPTDYPRPAVQRFYGALEVTFLPVELRDKVVALSQQMNVTLFMLLLGAFQVLLARYTGQEDICVGTVIANRTRPELEKLIGFFVNTLVLRTRLDGNPSFAEVVEQAREVALGAYAHQDVPFEKLVEMLQPERNLSRSPLFQVAFSVRQVADISTEEKTDELAFNELRTEHITTKFDLTMNVTSTPMGLRCGVEYNTDLFKAATIQRLLEHWHVLLESIVEAPNNLISDLSFTSTKEQDYLLKVWNTPQVYDTTPQCFHVLFMDQARRTPDAVAVVYEDVCITYRKLDRLTNQLAWYLRLQGIGPEVYVGVYVEPTPVLIMMLLAIFKAGGVYVPLDPNYPTERLSYMVNDARISFLLTERPVEERVLLAVPTVVCLEQLRPIIARMPVVPLENMVDVENVAYVIYTSGSTGNPKGTLVTHRGFGTLAQAQREICRVEPTSRVLQFAALSFDGSIWEFVSLLAGACLHLASREKLLPGMPLHELLREQAISQLALPPSALSVLPEEPLPGLETCIVVGEECKADLMRRWARGRRFLNGYGPTEMTVCASLTLCQPDRQKPGIEQSIFNTRFYLLDRQMRLVPAGMPGELYVEGSGLARGYLNRPDLIAECFVPHPFTEHEGVRLYKTGDMARLRVDGTLDFLGRSDRQVKLRGYRIELSGIEAAVLTHTAVHECAVVMQTEPTEEKRLVAYVVGHGETVLDLNGLRSHLAEMLPEPQIPAHLVQLASLPLNTSGKIDRQALMRRTGLQEIASWPLQDQQGEHQAESLHPRDDVEALLQIIWCEILQLEHIGLRDSFFDLGGHSLIAVRLAARIKEVFGCEFGLSDLFEHQTIEEIAAILRKEQVAGESVLVPIQPSGSYPPFFCVHPLGGTVFRYYLLSHILGEDYPFYGLQAPDLDGQGTTYDRIEDLAAHFVETIRGVQPEGPYLLGGWSIGGVIAFEMARQLCKQGHEVSLLALLDSEVENFPGVKPPSVPPLDISDQFLAQQMMKHYGIPAATEGSTDQEIQFSEVVDKLKKRGVFPEDSNVEQVRRFMRIIVANTYAIQTYIPQVYPGRLTLFRAQEGVRESKAGEPSDVLTRAVTRGWDELTSDKLDIHLVPGNHSTMLDEPQVQVLADLLRTCIDSASISILPTGVLKW